MPRLTRKALGRRLTRARTTRRLTRYAIAKRARIDLTYLRKLEEGRSSPTVEMLQKLATALDLTVVDLVR